MGGRFRLIIQEVEALELTEAMPNLPVARVLWKPQPSFKDGVKAWIYAGGAHHTVFSYDVDAEDLIDFARMTDIEYVHIHKDMDLRSLEKELMLNDMIWKLR
jgi:L-arabinose isomerase